MNNKTILEIVKGYGDKDIIDYVQNKLNQYMHRSYYNSCYWQTIKTFKCGADPFYIMEKGNKCVMDIALDRKQREDIILFLS